MKWYVSGPMTGYEKFNYPAFERAVAHLKQLGFDVVSPHSIDHGDGGVPGAVSYDTYLRNDLMALINGCDGIALLRGWPESRGARLELEIALGLGMEVAYLDEDAEWLGLFQFRRMSKRK